MNWLVSIAALTFFIEISLTYKMVSNGLLTIKDKLIATITFTLSSYQFSEVLTCGLRTDFGPHLGWFAISLLPPMGLHLASELGTYDKFTKPLYAVGISFAMFYGFIPGAVLTKRCGLLYVQYSNDSTSSLYGIYYNGTLLLTMILLSISLIHDWRSSSGFFSFSQPLETQLKAMLLLGYLGFTVPTVVVLLIIGPTNGGIPSIMCAFALILALVLYGMHLRIIDASSTSPAPVSDVVIH